MIPEYNPKMDGYISRHNSLFRTLLCNMVRTKMTHFLEEVFYQVFEVHEIDHDNMPKIPV